MLTGRKKEKQARQWHKKITHITLSCILSVAEVSWLCNKLQPCTCQESMMVKWGGTYAVGFSLIEKIAKACRRLQGTQERGRERVCATKQASHHHWESLPAYVLLWHPPKKDLTRITWEHPKPNYLGTNSSWPKLLVIEIGDRTVWLGSSFNDVLLLLFLLKKGRQRVRTVELTLHFFNERERERVSGGDQIDFLVINY